VRDWVREKYTVERLGSFGENDHVQINRIMWDLSVERIISWGTNRDSEACWPFFHVTPFGEEYIQNTAPHFLDPDGYIHYLAATAPGIDQVVLQYIHEATRAFKGQL
jgi:hypothetical protein